MLQVAADRDIPMEVDDQPFEEPLQNHIQDMDSALASHVLVETISLSTESESESESEPESESQTESEGYQTYSSDSTESDDPSHSDIEIIYSSI